MKPLLLFLLFLPLMLPAQNTGYRKTYKQPYKNPPDTLCAVHPRFANAPAVELQHFTNIKVNNRFFTTLLSGSVRTHILTQQGAQMCSVFSLPESFDPLYERSDLPATGTNQIHRPKFFDLDILYFHARIIKPNGKTVTLQPQDSIQAEVMHYDGLARTAYSYHFIFNDLQPGDVLEVEYACYLPFMIDYRRIFMHSLLPIQERIFELTLPLNEQVYTYLFNGLAPPDTLHKPAERQYHTLRWQMCNLAPALAELQANAALNLPHLFFYFHNKAFGDYENDQIVRFQPYTWSYYAYDMVGFRSINLQKTQRLMSYKEIALNIFYQKQTQTFTHKQAPQKLNRLIETLNTRFDYRTEPDALITADERVAKLGAFYRERLLKELNHRLFYHSMFDRISTVPFTDVVTEGYIGLTDAKREKVAMSIANNYLINTNRYEIYEGLLTRLEQDYYKVIAPDARISRLLPDTCLPVLGAEILYAMEHNDSLYYVFPKNNKFGYHVNELPFYLQGIPALHIWQMADNRFSPKVTFVAPTPLTGDTQTNRRFTQVNAAVNLSQNTTDFYAIITLSGQYATLLRGFYAHKTTDFTINPLYYRHPALLTPYTVLHSQKIEETQPHFPYTTQIHLTYSDNSLITPLTHTTYRLNLHHFAQHVFTHNFEAEGRNQPFYPDFAGTDEFQYTLQFEQPVFLPDDINQNITLHNELGQYALSITQTTPTTILFTSAFTTTATRVLPTKTAYVAAIYQQLQATEQATLTIHTTPVNKK
ncbi:MAG TPA: DUF3857 domain-containing protein [Chitinophagales bacterium]|nr:DUF3857 domain-containing protein [Chitinophagales bacterium]HRK28484.1 DUF3857 domain-containing protein [Chitinophagales bacterium]